MWRWNRTALSFVTNATLLLAGSILAFSGLLLQAIYHVGPGRSDKQLQTLGMNYCGWSDLHVVAMLAVSLLMIIHVTLHWKWYVTVVRARRFTKHRLVLTLTLVFVVVALTGYAPWLIRLTGGAELARRAVVEVHDKLALVLCVYLGIHTFRNLPWFLRAARKLGELSIVERTRSLGANSLPAHGTMRNTRARPSEPLKAVQ